VSWKCHLGGTDMPETTLTLSAATGRKLGELAERSGRPAAEIVERAVAELHRRAFWAAVDAGYEALRTDPVTWAQIEAERAEWDATLGDGLDPTEEWTESGSPRATPTTGESR
ncbi:MAG: hypothetical protein ACRDD1_21085, partial [Planctomycetia bacterium]